MNELIAIVDDEPDIRQLVSLHLQKAGYRVWSCRAAHEFFRWLESETPDLVVLDLMLPDIDGLEICKRLRQNPTQARISVVMLTARTDEFDKVLGLELGADDYITKPFSPRELVARVKAVLRRSQSTPPVAQEAICAGLVLNRQKHTVLADDRPLALTTTEFNLLAILAAKPGHVFTREQLLDQLWGEDKIVVPRSIDVHIKHLRAKLGKYAALLKNVRGVGYKLDL